MKELKIDSTHLESVLKQEKKANYYEGNIYGKIANLFFEPITKIFSDLFPKETKKIYDRIMNSGINILSLTYISIALFTSFLLLFIGSAIGVFIFYSSGITWTVLLGLIISIISLTIFYLYPIIKIRLRKRNINEELPFFITHLAAISNSSIEDLALFKTLLKSNYFPCLNIELRRIINGVKIYGLNLSNSIKIVSEITPSRNAQEFFEDLSENINKKMNLKTFLNTKSRMSLSKYRISHTSSIKRFGHTYSETKSAMRKLRFKWIYLLTILIGVIALVLDYTYLKDNLYIFMTVFVISLIFAWSIILFDLYSIIENNYKLENQFFRFVRDLKKNRSLSKIQEDYKELNPFVRKLQNQYRIGIPLDKALFTFANDSENKFILSSIKISLEAKRHGADIYEILDQISTSKMTRKVLKTDLV